MAIAGKKAAGKRGAAKKAAAKKSPPKPSESAPASENTGNGLGDAVTDNPPKEEGFVAGFRLICRKVRHGELGDVSLITLIAGTAFLLSVTSLLILGIFAGIIEVFDGDSPLLIRVIVLVLKVVGASSVLLLVVVTTDKYAKLFGYLIVAALIMGPNQIIGLVLAVQDSDRRVGQYIVQASRSDAAGRSQDDAAVLGLVISSSVQKFLEKNEEELNVEFGDIAVGLEENLRATLRHFEESRLLRSVLSFDSLAILRAFADGRGEQVFASYREEPEFLEGLRHLRREGLISMISAQSDAAEITKMGCVVVRAYSDRIYRVCDAHYTDAETRPTPLPVPHAVSQVTGLPTLQGIGLDEQLDESNFLQNLPVEWSTELTGGPRVFLLEVPNLEQDTVLYIRTESDFLVDPVLEIFEGQPDTAINQPVNLNSVSILYSGDDELPNLDAEVAIPHSDGKTYWISVREFSDYPGYVKLVLSTERGESVELGSSAAQTDTRVVRSVNPDTVQQQSDSAEGNDKDFVFEISIGAPGELIQIDLPIFDEGDDVFLWTESSEQGVDPVLNIYRVTDRFEDGASINTSDLATPISSDDREAADPLHPYVQLQHSDGEVYILDLYEFSSEERNVTFHISNTRPNHQAAPYVLQESDP